MQRLVAVARGPPISSEWHSRSGGVHARQPLQKRGLVLGRAQQRRHDFVESEVCQLRHRGQSARALTNRADLLTETFSGTTRGLLENSLTLPPWRIRRPIPVVTLEGLSTSTSNR
jgi:hypothetical protein